MHRHKKDPEKYIEISSLFPPSMDYVFFDNGKRNQLEYRGKGFNLLNSWWMADASFLAYNHPGFARLAWNVAGYKNFISFKGKNVASCFIAYNKKTVIVSFRGTEINSTRMFPAVIADLNLSLVPEGKRGKVHHGFQKVLDEIWWGEEMLESCLYQIRSKNQGIRFFFTGHSLGGAMALIAASRFRYADFVYTFGCPRTGNRKFSDSIKAEVYRIVNNYDAVTMLPPKKIIKHLVNEEYHHTGELKYLDSDGSVCDRIVDKIYWGSGSDREMLVSGGIDKVITSFIENFNIDFKDHSPLLYSVKLWNAYTDSVNRSEVDQSP